MVVERMAVVGAGQMGAGIAQLAAQAGIDVVLADATARAGAGRRGAGGLGPGDAGGEGQDLGR